jgi:L-lactate dehydrogenase complex protein LldG
VSADELTAGRDELDLAARFAARAEQAGSRVHQLPDWPAAAGLALSLVETGSIAVPAWLARAQPILGHILGDRLLVPDPDGPTEAATARVGITAAVLGVAETGSVLVDEHDLADRVVSMLTESLVQVVERTALRASLDDAQQWLSACAGAAGYRALVTGPSRTADIERSLTIGVQGPAETHAVILGDGEAESGDEPRGLA